MWIFSNTFGGAAVSLGFAYYLIALWPVLPATYVAAIICLTFTAINYYGIRESARLNSILVAAKLLILALFIILGLPHISQANFVPFKPFEVGVFYGAFYIFFAFGGFARAAVVAEEIKDAKRNVPRAIILALVISAIVYMLVGTVAVGLAGADRLASSNSPLAEAISATGAKAAVLIVSVGGMLATASVLLTSILGVSRMAYAMAKRKDLPEAVGKLDSKRNTPYYSVLITGFVMTLLVLLVDLTRVVAISTFALLFFYTFASTISEHFWIPSPVAETLGCLTSLMSFSTNSSTCPSMYE
jgi:APA family basic amino acid/polyamine antiporter